MNETDMCVFQRKILSKGADTLYILPIDISRHTYGMSANNTKDI